MTHKFSRDTKPDLPLPYLIMKICKCCNFCIFRSQLFLASQHKPQHHLSTSNGNSPHAIFYLVCLHISYIVFIYTWTQQLIHGPSNSLFHCKVCLRAILKLIGIKVVIYQAGLCSVKINTGHFREIYSCWIVHIQRASKSSIIPLIKEGSQQGSSIPLP